jgi:hypothetical protein
MSDEGMSDEERARAAWAFGWQMAQAYVHMAKAREAYILGILEGFKKEPTKGDYALTPDAAPKGAALCKNCGRTICQIPQGSGKRWMHYDKDHPGLDFMQAACPSETVAEPKGT